MTIFEKPNDLDREEKAIKLFVSLFSGFYTKLDQFDIDYKVFNSEKKLISFVEVKGRKRNILDAYPLPISIMKLIKLAEKKINPVLIWCCDDGIIYGKINKIEGFIKYGGRIPRAGSAHDMELMAYYDRQDELKEIKF